MPTPEELDQYGAGLSIWEQLRLFQEWSPLIGYAQRFTMEEDAYARSKVVAIAKTKEGEDLIRWALAKSGAA